MGVETRVRWDADQAVCVFFVLLLFLKCLVPCTLFIR